MERDGRLILVTGGARCGKSSFAEKLARERGGEKVTYIATCQAGDEEMAKRITLHQERRPRKWHTVEEPLHVAAAIEEWGFKSAAVLVDCMALLVSNYLTGGDLSEGPHIREDLEDAVGRVESEIRSIREVALKVPARVILVTNEVGWGLVPTNALGRLYRDLLGKANTTLAAGADEVYLVVAGIPIELKAKAR